MRTGILSVVMMIAALLVLGPILRAQVTVDDLQNLKPQAKELMIPLPGGPVLRGDGLDDWLSGFGPGGERGVARGFAGSKKSDDQKFFNLGELYTSLLIQARSSSTMDAVAGLDSFRQALILLQAPPGFFSYLNQFELLLKSEAGGTETSGRFAAAMEGFLTDFVRSKGEGAYLKFQAGRWVTTMALAAHSHDVTGMQLSAASFFREHMASNNAQPAVVDTLKELERFASLKTLADADFSKIETLAQRLREQLG